MKIGRATNWMCRFSGLLQDPVTGWILQGADGGQLPARGLLKGVPQIGSYERKEKTGQVASVDSMQSSGIGIAHQIVH